MLPSVRHDGAPCYFQAATAATVHGRPKTYLKHLPLSACRFLALKMSNNGIKYKCKYLVSACRFLAQKNLLLLQLGFHRLLTEPALILRNLGLVDRQAFLTALFNEPDR